MPMSLIRIQRPNNLGNLVLEMSKDEILPVVSEIKSLGRMLSFSVVLHCLVKNLLKKC